MRGTTVLPLAAMVVVLLHAASRAAGAGGGGDGSCGSMKLPYPFGFSSGCTIRLGCDDGVPWLGDTRKLGLVVRNVTARGIILDLIPDCSRAFNASLFSENYVPVSGNTLVVSSCSPATQGADMCTGLVSSGSYVDEPVPVEELRALELDWWVPGRCRCSPSANCIQVVAPTTGQEAFRYQCMEAFDGDGFIDARRYRLPATSTHT